MLKVRLGYDGSTIAGLLQWEWVQKRLLDEALGFCPHDGEDHDEGTAEKEARQLVILDATRTDTSLKRYAATMARRLPEVVEKPTGYCVWRTNEC